MIEKLKTMLALQDETNQRLHPEWKTQGWDFLLAARMEASEAIDHLGYKWWAPKEPDYDQVRMEVVDIWHFLLSGLASKPTETQPPFLRAVANAFSEKALSGWSEDIALPDTLSWVMAGDDLVESFEAIAKTMQLLGLSFEQVYKLYIGKAALNRFRWANDYGTNYRKVWSGREDNEHLTEILSQMTDDEVSVDEVMARLDERYQACMSEHYETIFGGR